MTDDLISRTILIEKLGISAKCVDCQHKLNGLCLWKPNMVDVCEVITEMPSAHPEPRWIPVTERLPDDGEDVLITFCGEEETRIVPVNYYQKIWFDCIFDIELNPHMVTAWMPLPAPWKGE